MKLPKLIQEIIDYYLYHVPWKAMMIKVNKEYYDRCCLHLLSSGRTWLRIFTNGKKVPKIILGICCVNGQYIRDPRMDIRSFLNEFYVLPCIKLPTKYYYSSGLNHPFAYK